jgi:hypothetical protein
MTNSADAVAAFLTSGGKVNKVGMGVNSGISDRAFYLASQGNLSLKAKPEDETRYERQTETFRETRYAGGTVSQALDDMNEVK